MNVGAATSQMMTLHTEDSPLRWLVPKLLTGGKRAARLRTFIAAMLYL